MPVELAQELQERDENSAASRAQKEREEQRKRAAQKEKANQARGDKSGDMKTTPAQGKSGNESAGPDQVNRTRAAAQDKVMTGAEQIAAALRHRVEALAEIAAGHSTGK